MILLQTGKKNNYVFLSDSSYDTNRVFKSTLKGDNEVIDNTGDTWQWFIDDGNALLDIISVIAIKGYTEADDLTELSTTEKTYFFDGVDLYVKFESGNEFFNYSNVSATLFTKGLTDNISKLTDNYYYDFFYIPTATFNTFSKKINDLKSGLVPLSSFQFDYVNNSNETIADFGSKVLMYDEDFNSLYQGIITDRKKDRFKESYSSDFVKFFTTESVCQNVFNTDELIDEKYIGKNIPVAYGEINKGICIPVNSASFDKKIGGNIRYIAADLEYGEVTINKVFDENDNELSFVDVSGNSFELVIDADSEINIDTIKWQGVGYDGITNGLDIIKKVLVEQGDNAYTDANYDISAWSNATSIFTEKVGLSIQSNKTILTEIIEPISNSLYGVVNILNDGRLTWSYSDSSKNIVGSITLSNRLGKVIFDESLKNVSSRIEYVYNNDYVKKDLSYSYIDTSNEVFVGNEYQKKDITTYKTALSNKDDVLNLAVKLSPIFSVIQNILTVNTKMQAMSWELYDNINVETGTILDSDIKKVEIIGKTIDFDRKQIKLTCREV